MTRTYLLQTQLLLFNNIEKRVRFVTAFSFCPNNAQNTTDADNVIIRRTYKMETFQGITDNGT